MFFERTRTHEDLRLIPGPPSWCSSPLQLWAYGQVRDIEMYLPGGEEPSGIRGAPLRGGELHLRDHGRRQLPGEQRAGFRTLAGYIFGSNATGQKIQP